MAVEADVAAASDHVVQFYGRDEELVDRVGPHLADALRRGDVAIVIATEAHNRAFDAVIAHAGVDIARARGEGRLVTVDAAATLSRFMIDGRPDAQRFDAVIGGIVRGAIRTGREVTAFGEMVGLLWEAGDVAAAIELEDLWNRLGREIRFSLWCGYHAVAEPGDECADAFTAVRGLHSAVVEPGEHRVQHDTRSFDRSLQAPRAARRFVADVLHRWGRGDYVDDAVLIVSELATNAVVHALSSPSVSVSAHPGAVRISVRDAVRTRPLSVSTPAHTSRSGRGLGLVAALATAWGSDADDDGKVVWAELRR